jgi:arginine decarboxylase
MPGESAGRADGAVLQYLEALEDWDRLFPGFEHDTHGVDHIDGKYLVSCLKTADMA